MLVHFGPSVISPALSELLLNLSVTRNFATEFLIFQRRTQRFRPDGAHQPFYIIYDLLCAVCTLVVDAFVLHPSEFKIKIEITA